MESIMVFIVGLVARFAVFVLLFALFSLPLIAGIYLWRGSLALRDRVAGTVDAGGALWKPGVTYTSDHAWLKRIWGRGIVVGLDDVARRILAGVSEVILPPVGTPIRRGQTLAAVRCGERLAVIPSPVDGVVLARNRALMDEPGIFERSPYGDGWMIRVKANPVTGADARRGRAARAWLGEENVRLARFLETRLGMASADGGTLTRPASHLLSEDAWREAIHLFLKAA